MKHFCTVPRPIDLTPKVQPVIQPPGHSSYPSGHATEAFCFAVMLAALRRKTTKGAEGSFADWLMGQLAKPAADQGAADTAEDWLILLFRLATRIAENRTIAGVHYPVDSAHGAILGLSLTLGFIAHCEGGGGEQPVVDAVGNAWCTGETAPGDFTLSNWRAEMVQIGRLEKKGTYRVAANAPWHSLPAVWEAAVAEWTGEAAYTP